MCTKSDAGIRVKLSVAHEIQKTQRNAPSTTHESKSEKRGSARQFPRLFTFFKQAASFWKINSP